MGSSDPLPAGFEIWFGSLNFQTTGNDYLSASPTVTSSTHGGRPGQGRSPSHPLLMSRRPPKRMLRAPQHHDADDAPASALDRRGWNDVGPHVSPHNATHPSARRQPHPRGSVQFPSRGSPTGCVTPRWRTPRPPAPTWRRTRIFPATTSWRSGTSSPPPMMSPTTAPPASYHLALRMDTRS
jgi:hypothetical protein